MEKLVVDKLENKIAVIGDIHAEHVRLELLLRILTELDVDKIMSVGDIVDGKGSVDECCALLSKHNVVTVSGNHERWCLESQNRNVEYATDVFQLREETVDFLIALPELVTFSSCLGDAMLCHGLGESNMASVKPSDSLEDISYNIELNYLYRKKNLNMIFNGHTHRSGVRNFGHLNVINAGSLINTKEACAFILDLEEGQVKFIVMDEENQISVLDAVQL